MSIPSDPSSPESQPLKPYNPVPLTPASGGKPAPFTPSQSTDKSLAMWQKFLGPGATIEQAQQFRNQLLNMITSQAKNEMAKTREKMKEDFKMSQGQD